MEKETVTPSPVPDEVIETEENVDQAEEVEDVETEVDENEVNENEEGK